MWGPIKSQIEPVQIFTVGDVNIIFSTKIAFCTVLVIILEGKLIEIIFTEKPSI